MVDQDKSVGEGELPNPGRPFGQRLAIWLGTCLCAGVLSAIPGRTFFGARSIRCFVLGPFSEIISRLASRAHMESGPAMALAITGIALMGMMTSYLVHPRKWTAVATFIAAFCWSSLGWIMEGTIIGSLLDGHV